MPLILLLLSNAYIGPIFFPNNNPNTFQCCNIQVRVLPKQVRTAKGSGKILFLLTNGKEKKRKFLHTNKSNRI